jgi:hypothetical protein
LGKRLRSEELEEEALVESRLGREDFREASRERREGSHTSCLAGDELAYEKER